VGIAIVREVISQIMVVITQIILYPFITGTALPRGDSSNQYVSPLFQNIEHFDLKLPYFTANPATSGNFP
jgi:hypothetical protein